MVGRDGPLTYRATAAHMLVKDETDKLKATIFFVAYERTNGPGAAERTEGSGSEGATGSAAPERHSRPITFVFNGGPGAAAVWLHLGALGPRRIRLDEEGRPPAPPYALTDNEWTWLDFTDLVFIDPVGTGFSRPAEGEKREQFYGVEEDIYWVAEFIRLYITEYGRWLSPILLAGESYGTTRAAGLSERLLDRFGIALNGIVLISSVLDFQTLRPGSGNDLPYVLYLPTYASIAWYHRRIEDPPAELPSLLREVESWAMSVYGPALTQGAALPRKQRDAVIERLSRYTGLSPEYIDRADLRIAPDEFRKRLLETRRALVGRFDGRITGDDPHPTADSPSYDPSLSGYLPVYTSTFNDYVRRELGFQSTLPYEVLSSRVMPWRFPDSGTGYLYVADSLRDAMIKNPHLRVFFASGYFDLATPYYATDYTIEHMGLSQRLRRNIERGFYYGGHMMYHHRQSLGKLHSDVAAFVRRAVRKDQ